MRNWSHLTKIFLGFIEKHWTVLLIVSLNSGVKWKFQSFPLFLSDHGLTCKSHFEHCYDTSNMSIFEFETLDRL